jgi:hypothetical protein
MKRVIIRKGLAHRLRKPRRRAESPPPTPKMMEPGEWEKVVLAHIEDVEDPDWWLQHVR